MNVTGSRIFNRNRTKPFHLLVLVSFGAQSVITPVVALADVAVPPPAHHQSANFPSDQKLKQMGYDKQTGVWRVKVENNGKPHVSKSGETITGTQNKTVNVTGNYGEKASIQTQGSQTVSTGKLQKAINLAVVGAAGANAANSAAPHAANLAKNLANGNYGGAIWNGVQTIANGVDGFFGSPAAAIVNVFSGAANAYLDETNKMNTDASNREVNEKTAKKIAEHAAKNQAAAEKAGDFKTAVKNAALNKAANAAATAENQSKPKDIKPEAGKYKTVLRFEEFARKKAEYKNGKYIPEERVSNVTWIVVNTTAYLNNGYFRTYRDGALKGSSLNANIYGAQVSIALKFENKKVYEGQAVDVSAYAGTLENIAKTSKANVKPNDFTLNNEEIAGILRNMLQSQNTNHAQLMNQLATIGNAVEQATTARSYTPSSATSAPYTPAGSNQAQQTRFHIDEKGNVTASIVPRPDLKPNSSQAPSREQIVINNIHNHAPSNTGTAGAGKAQQGQGS